MRRPFSISSSFRNEFRDKTEICRKGTEAKVDGMGRTDRGGWRPSFPIEFALSKKEYTVLQIYVIPY